LLKACASRSTFFALREDTTFESLRSLFAFSAMASASTGRPKEEIREEWTEFMNMRPAELDHWLGSEDGRSVVDNPDGE
jgi:hypothetical protein